MTNQMVVQSGPGVTTKGTMSVRGEKAPKLKQLKPMG